MKPLEINISNINLIDNVLLEYLGESTLFSSLEKTQKIKAMIDELENILQKETCKVQLLIDDLKKIYSEEKNKKYNYQKNLFPHINKEGELFLDFLRDGLNKKTFDINKVNAQIHIVEGMFCLVSPRIFIDFINSTYYEKTKFSKNIQTKDNFNKTLKNIQSKIFECQLHYRDLTWADTLDFTVVGDKRTSKIKGFLLKNDVVKLLTQTDFQISRNVSLNSVVLELK